MPKKEVNSNLRQQFHVHIHLSPLSLALSLNLCLSLPMQSLYDFAYTSESVPPRFTLVTNFPKKELHCSEDGGPSLGELSLGPKSVVFMKDESD